MEMITSKLASWASILEPKTKAQAIETASMDFVQPYLALMPDAHLGRGSTVGSVIPTVGAIMPAAVGVDIGCVDAESEYLSPTGWRKISDYQGGLVMQYDPDTRTGRFVQPGEYIVRPCEMFYRFKTKYGIDQMLSDDHRVLCWKITGRERNRVRTVMTAAEFTAAHNRLVQGMKAEFATTFTPEIFTKVELSDAEIRVQVMVNADAHLERGKTAVVKLKKERKILRAKEILSYASIPYTVSETTDGCTVFRFTPPLPTKSFEFFWQASAEQLAIIAGECLQWDGNEEARCFYTRDKEAANLIQYAFTAIGYRAVLREDTHYRDGKLDYRVFFHPDTMVGMGGSPKTPIETVLSMDGKAYCFTVPSGFWVMRRGGNVVMTGNCGMMARRTDLTAENVKELGGLADLHKKISQAIPLSAGNYNKTWWGRTSTQRYVKELDVMPGIDSAEMVSPNWRMQLGSLGSGNHFIELSLDEDDYLWLFLHSGSRGVGNRLATRHIQIALEQCQQAKVKLPNRDLAFLTEGTQEFDDYIRDLRWAQHFALLNRAEMMDRVVHEVFEWAGAPLTITEQVQCHHNYTEQQEDGTWLSRKGAIDATEGRWGLIPGSMGTRSYVVEGRGCKEAFNSAPHGAGRNFSRSAAKREFTRDDLDTRMEGIVWGESDAFLDEHPNAYKDIDVVMKDAEELVEVKHELRQIVNVKGN